MSDAEETAAVEAPATGGQPARKRSPLERAVVWGGILLLLAVVTFEWTAQRGYNATLNHLEQTLDTQSTIRLDDLPQYVHGYVVREESPDGEGRVVTLRWPSVFKLYKLYVPAERNNVISAFETEESRANPRSPVEHTPLQPAEGTPTTLGPGGPAPAAPSSTGATAPAQPGDPAQPGSPAPAGSDQPSPKE